MASPLKPLRKPLQLSGKFTVLKRRTGILPCREEIVKNSRSMGVSQNRWKISAGIADELPGLRPFLFAAHPGTAQG
jgi:hypothetical protein